MQHYRCEPEHSPLLYGMITNYNDTALQLGPDRKGLITRILLSKRIKMRGFSIFAD